MPQLSLKGINLQSYIDLSKIKSVYKYIFKNRFNAYKLHKKGERMDLKEINQIADIIANINTEHQVLEKKKAEIQNRFNKRMAKNQSSIDELETKKKSIEKLRYFKREEIISVIAYLVSLIEETEYYYVEQVLPISWDYELITNEYDYRNKRDELKLRICYLCQNKQKAEEEIKYYLIRLQNSSYSRSYNKLKEFLLLPKDYYIQLSVFSKHWGSSDLKFVNNIDIQEVYYRDYHICYEETTTEYKNYLSDYESHIRDERFNYIIDFMEYLSGKRYESETHELSVEEMRAYAEEFATEYKKYDVMIRIRERQNGE